MNNYLYLSHNDENNSKTCIDIREVAYFNSKEEGSIFFLFKNGHSLRVNCTSDLKKQINSFFDKWWQKNDSVNNNDSTSNKREKISTEEAVAIALISSTPDWEQEKLKKELFPDENKFSSGAAKMLNKLGVKIESIS